MAILQRISRKMFSCGYLPSKWYRRTGKRKSAKLLLFIFITSFIGLLMIKPDRHFIINIMEERHSEKKFPMKMLREGSNLQQYDVKEDPASRHLMGIKNCSQLPTELYGPLSINPNITPSFDDVRHVAGKDLQIGGCYTPLTCKPIQKVAIIIPFKDRDAHLKTLLYYLHPILKRQKTQYCIYVAEQLDNGQFNKAMIMNAAFEEAMKADNYDCIIFHDVDMIPEDDRNMYMCGNQPRHLSPAIDKFEYKPHYGTDFGGVTGISPQQYRKANGHSNQFWGWGGEDNDMEFRIFYNDMKIVPSKLKYGRYKMIVHKHPWKFSPNQFPFQLNKTREARAHVDGLSDLKYRLVNTDKHAEYTKFIIDIRKIEVKRITLFINDKATMDIDIEPGPCRWEQYDGKYLDFNIDLATVKEASHLKALYEQPTNAPTPANLKISIPPIKTKTSFSLVNNFTEAIELCDKIYPECQGVQKENSDEKYSLRRSGMARNIVITGPAQPYVKLKNVVAQPQTHMPMRKFYFPHKTPFVKYCPGGSGGHFQTVKSALLIDKSDISSSRHNHTYSFAVHFSVLLKPSNHLYYKDNKHFEAQLSKGQNFYTFHWPNGDSPNFLDPDTAREYTFKTGDFSIPNIPGCYAVESKIQDSFSQPYFQWNWWFEITTGDREVDARTREAYWRKLMEDTAAMKKAEQYRSETRQREEAQIKREREFQRKMSELHNKELKIQENHLRKNGIVLNNEELKEVNVQGIKERVDRLTEDKERKEHEWLSENVGKIEVYDPKKNLPRVKQAVPHLARVQVEQQKDRAFHASLPKHLKNEIHL